MSPTSSPTSRRRLHIALLASFIAILILTLIRPKDLFTWFLESFPAIIGAAILLATYRRFEWTTLVYLLMWLHAIILVVGGHYTYAEVPLFNWIRDAFHLSRNHYDRVGHFAQGFVPAMIAREFLLRRSPLRQGKLLAYIIVSICLAISAAYELLEFGISVLTGSAGDAFLGTQGDIWDTQKDMLMALVGSITALLTLSHLHDQQLTRLADARNNRRAGV